MLVWKILGQLVMEVVVSVLCENKIVVHPVMWDDKGQWVMEDRGDGLWLYLKLHTQRDPEKLERRVRKIIGPQALVDWVGYGKCMMGPKFRGLKDVGVWQVFGPIPRERVRGGVAHELCETNLKVFQPVNMIRGIK